MSLSIVIVFDASSTASEIFSVSSRTPLRSLCCHVRRHPWNAQVETQTLCSCTIGYLGQGNVNVGTLTHLRCNAVAARRGSVIKPPCRGASVQHGMQPQRILPECRHERAVFFECVYDILDLLEDWNPWIRCAEQNIRSWEVYCRALQGSHLS